MGTHGADAVGDVVGDDAAKGTHAVEDQKQVERLLKRKGVLGETIPREDRQVVEGYVDAPEELDTKVSTSYL